jgi:hypothetical protein
MNKLLTERERQHSHAKYRAIRHTKYNSLLNDGEVGGKQGVTKPHKQRYDQKSFNENLNPLLGYLHRSVGRPWDKVYSEICEAFDTRKVINRHILVHLADFVILDAVMRDGVVSKLDTGYTGKREKDYEARWRPLSEWTESQSYPLYYKHPIDGLLKIQKGPSYRQVRKQRDQAREAEHAKVYRRIAPLVEAINHNGIWYRCEWEPYPEPTVIYVCPPLRTPEMYGVASWSDLSDETKRKHGQAVNRYDYKPGHIPGYELCKVIENISRVERFSKEVLGSTVRRGADGNKPKLAKFYLRDVTQCSHNQLRDYGLVNTHVAKQRSRRGR